MQHFFYVNVVVVGLFILAILSQWFSKRTDFPFPYVFTTFLLAGFIFFRFAILGSSSDVS
ncbi:hypothetical protein P3W23_14875 [Luteibacter sp. PPL554]